MHSQSVLVCSNWTLDNHARTKRDVCNFCEEKKNTITDNSINDFRSAYTRTSTRILVQAGKERLYVRVVRLTVYNKFSLWVWYREDQELRNSRTSAMPFWWPVCIHTIHKRALECAVWKSLISSTDSKINKSSFFLYTSEKRWEVWTLCVLTWERMKTLTSELEPMMNLCVVGDTWSHLVMSVRVNTPRIAGLFRRADLSSRVLVGTSDISNGEFGWLLFQQLSFLRFNTFAYCVAKVCSRLNLYTKRWNVIVMVINVFERM